MSRTLSGIEDHTTDLFMMNSAELHVLWFYGNQKSLIIWSVIMIDQN